MFRYISHLYLESSCEMLHITGTAAVSYHILAYIKLVCKIPDDGKVICRNM